MSATKDGAGNLDDNDLNVPSSRNVSSEVPISSNSKQKGPGGSSLRNESEAKGRIGYLHDK